MKKILFVILIVILTISLQVTAVIAVDKSLSSAIILSGGGNTASGGGNSGGGVIVSEYRVSGTIYLPAGVTAPEGGIEIYGGFGGVSYGEVSLFSAPDYTEEHAAVEYENIGIIATIPEGQSYVNYVATCKIAGSYKGIYGKFWVCDNVICGERVLSNKQIFSAPANLKADVYAYSNINCTLNFAQEVAEYSISRDSVLESENIETDVYVIAYDGYDRYISRMHCSDDLCGSGVINLEERGSYTLYYYIPQSTRQALQKLDKGLFNTGALDYENTNNIILKSQRYISGLISLPDGYKASGDTEITLKTAENEARIVIPEGEDSASYIVGAFNREQEYLQISADDEHIISGYVSGYDGNLVDYSYDLWYNDVVYHTSVTDFDITLKEQYLIKGQITLPQEAYMLENTFFTVYVTAKNCLSGFAVREAVRILSDTETAEYTIKIPKSECVGGFVISYDYGSYSEVLVPSSAISPLSSFKSGSSGSSGGGGGGTSGGSGAYSFQAPENLLYNNKLYMGDTEVTLIEEDAEIYEFVNRGIQKDIVLAGIESSVKGVIAGYFDNYVKADIHKPIEVSLYDAETDSFIKKITINANEGYCITKVSQGSYKLGFRYNDRQYYYNRYYLVDTIDNAEIISLNSAALFLNHKDVHCDNVFRTNIKLILKRVIIDGNNYSWNDLKIYDPYGAVYNETYGSDAITADISSFYIGIGDYYVSEFLQGANVVTKLVDDIDKAYLFNAKYYDTLSRDLYYTGGQLTVNATTDFVKNPITSTAYTIFGSNIINLTVTTKRPIDNGKIAAIEYDEGGRVIDVHFEECIYPECEYAFSMNYSPDAYKLKVTVWDSMRPMMPLSKAEEMIIPSYDMYYNDILKSISRGYFTNGKTNCYINGKERDLDIPATEVNGVTYVPLRYMCKAIDGGFVKWNKYNNSVTISNDYTECTVIVGSNIAKREERHGDGEEIFMSACPIIVNEQVLVPVAEIGGLFGFEAYIDNKNGVIAIFDELAGRTKYTFDNCLLDKDKIDISYMDGNITRGEMASLLVKLFERSTGTIVIPSDFCFTDEEYQNSIDGDVAKISTLEIMNGYEDGRFRPNSSMTYAEAIYFIHKTVLKADENLPEKYTTVPEYTNISADSDYWYTNYLYSAKRLGLLDDVCYNAISIDDYVNRRDAIAIIANAYYQITNKSAAND